MDALDFFHSPNGVDFDAAARSGNIQNIHHLARYHWAKEVAIGCSAKTILDVGCGSGYGAYIIAAGNPSASVIGIDSSSKAIELANSEYKLPNLSFFIGDACSWSHIKGAKQAEALGEFDLICAFDLIANLSFREIFLLRVAGALSRQGALLLSTPCSKFNSTLLYDGGVPKIEFGYKDLRTLLSLFFHEVYSAVEPGFFYPDFWAKRVNGEKIIYDTKNNPLICRNTK